MHLSWLQAEPTRLTGSCKGNNIRLRLGHLVVIKLEVLKSWHPNRPWDLYRESMVGTVTRINFISAVYKLSYFG